MNNRAVDYLLQHPTPTEPLRGHKIESSIFNNDKIFKKNNILYKEQIKLFKLKNYLID